MVEVKMTRQQTLFFYNFPIALFYKNVCLTNTYPPRRVNITEFRSRDGEGSTQILWRGFANLR